MSMQMGVDTEVIMLRALLPVCCCHCLRWLCYRWYGAMGEVAALVLGDVAIFVVAIVCQNADINMSGLGVNHPSTVGDCAIAGGCPGGDSDCDGDVLWLCQWGEATEQQRGQG